VAPKVSGKKLQARVADATIALDVHADGSVGIDGGSYAVEQIEPGVYLVTDGTRRWTVAVAGSPDERWVSVDGHTAIVEIASADSTSRKKTRGGGHDALMAPMPATVVKLLVEPGGLVAEGDTLIVLEAMKMELAVRAPRAGTVSKINCQVGELVQPGAALLELDA
jgi:oxaloacetate decarboxylase alpha subunit